MGLLHDISRFLRGFLTALLIVLVVLVAVIAYLGFTASGNQFLANRIADQVSTPDMQISLEGASGLLEGRFHLDRVTLADTRGKFAEVEGLDLFWNPSELFKWRFHADRIAAAKVAFDRLPVKTIDTPPSDSSFSLPIEVKVDSFDLPSIALGKAIAKQDTFLGLNGSAQAVADRIALELNASEKDRLNATAKASVTYAVNAQTLTLDGAVSEPQGGLLARLLALPGQPPVEIALKGAGPIRDWKGSISGRVAGKDVLLLSGSYRQAETGIHEVMLNGGGKISEFMPSEFRPLFDGETKIDVDARFDETGLIDIRAGTITNDSFRLIANGTLDPKGEANLVADLSPAKQAVHVELPLASGPVQADIAKASVTLSGAFRSATVDVSADIASLATPDLHAGNISVTAHSGDLNLTNKTATLSYALGIDTLALKDPDIAKVVQGPVRLKGNLSLSPDSIAVAQSDLESRKLGGKLSGRFDRTAQTAAANFNLFLLPQGLLPPAIEAKISGTIGLSGQLAATLPSTVSVQNLKLTSNLLTAVGSASLEDGTVKAMFAGDVLDIGNVADKAAGKVHFTLTAGGPLARPDIAAHLASTEIRFADKALQAVDLTLTSALDMKKPAGKLALSANYQGQPINLSADAALDDGRVAIPALSLAIGKNGMTGALDLDKALLPAGKLAFDFPDIAALAKLAGQQDVAGALKGTLDLAPRDGKIAGTLTANGPSLSAAGVDISNPGASIEIADLVAQTMKGRITADKIAVGANHLDRIALDLDLANRQIGFDLASQFDAAPLTAKGTVIQQDEGLTVKLASFAAAPRKVPVTLAAPADIVVRNGAVQLADMALKTGDGSLTVTGTAGKTLDLDAKVAGLPLSLANSFVAELDAAGTLSGNFTVSGDAASPAVSFSASVENLATSQTRKAGLPALFLAADGQFANKRLSIDIERGESVHTAENNVLTPLLKAEMQLGGDGILVPSFRLDFEKNTISGALALDRAFMPSGRISFDLPDIAAMAAFVGGKAEGAVKGTVDLASKDGRIDAKVDAHGEVRGQAIEALAEATSDHGALALPSLKVDIGRNTLSGAVTLDGALMPSGKVTFDFPDVALLAAMAGQTAEGAIKGGAEIASKDGRIDAEVAATGTIRGHDIDIRTDLVSDRGAISVPAFSARIGPNSLAAALALDSAFLPSGKVTFDFPDIALLAGMAGQKAEGALKGSADIVSSDGRIDTKVLATGAIRGQTIDIRTNVVLDKGALSLPALTAAIGPNTISGAVTLDSRFMPSGKIDFDLPDMALLAAMAGQKAEGAVKGSAHIASTGKRIDANVTATGLIRGQAIDIKTTVVSDDGAISIPSLKADVGANTLSGTLALDKAFLPTGAFDFDFPDIGLLAAFAGQKAEGALKGSAAIRSADGKISGTISASGETISASGARIVNPSIDLEIADLLAGQVSGHVRADEVTSGANHLDKLNLDVALVGGQTRFDLDGRFDDAPLLAKGQMEPKDGGLLLTLSSFEGAPRKIPIKLAHPTTVVVKDGTAAFKDLTITAGDSAISIDGNAGTALDLKAKVTALPLSLVNILSPDLAAAGAVSADIGIKGTATNPAVTFDARLKDIATVQTRNAKLPALDIAAKGIFADNTLSLTADSDLRGQAVKAEAQVKLDDGRVAIPSFSAAIGKSRFSGTIALDQSFQPSGKIAFDIPDADALASVVGQKAEGAVKGTADIASRDGKIDIKVVADGTVRNQAIKALADISLDKGAVSLPSLKLDVGKNSVSGAVTLDQRFMPSGKITFDLPDVALLAAMAGQKAEGAVKGTADITSSQDRTDARIAATGLIRKQAIDINLEAVRQGETISLPSLKLDVGKNTLSGALTLDKTFMPSGKVSFDFPDIALLAAFAGQKAEGALKGLADIKADNGKISGRISADGTKIVAAGAEIVKPVVDLTIADLATGQVSGKVTAERIASGANALANLSLDFGHAGNKTDFDLKSRYDNAPLTAKGAIEQQPDGLVVSLDSFAAAPKAIAVRLNKPTKIAVRNGAVSLSALSIKAGQGTIAVNGAAGDKLDLTAKVTALPASLANAFAPDLGATGSISATITVKGDSAAPVVAFDTSWQNAAIKQTRENGLSNFTITAKGQLANNVLTLNANARGAGGLSLNAGGTVGIAGNQALNIKVNGQLPFAAIEAKLAAQGLDLRGNARFDLTVTGSAANPAINGRISTSGATLTAIRQNLTIKNLAASITLDGKTARIASLSGNLSGGGTVSVSGTIGIAPNSGFPADIRIALKNAVYTDGKVVAAKLGGDMAITGSLVGSPTLGGAIRIRRADITIPQKLPGTLAQLDIKHRNASRQVLVQAKEIKDNQPGTKTGKDAGGITFDLKIIAPRQIFVRGRGLDAELGGTIVLTGSASNPNAAGGFKMIRGRLSIIGRRLDFTEGEINFGGDLTPALNLVATSTVEATTINVIVAGLANNPQVTFTSSPALPQDEVMALLIFGRNSADLSPVQIAQLADAVSTLAGGQSNSLFNKLRQGLGVDDLDVGTDENGKSNVSVGKYLNKRTYLQLQQDVDDNTSSAIINLDIGKGVKLKGQAGTDGSTSGGVFFEKEY